MAVTVNQELLDEVNKFVKSMCRHLVVLSGEYESYDEGKLLKRGIFALSGFVLRLHDHRFWCTAGHCLTKLDTAIRNGSLKLFNVGWFDGFGPEAKHSQKYPYEYEPSCGFPIDEGEHGLDFGVIPLDSVTVQNFDANGVKDVGRENWEHQHELSFDKYMICGVPSHLSQEWESPDGTLNGAVRPVLIPIERIDPFELDQPPPEDWFVGKICDHVQIDSIEGMSGGPIFGFRALSGGRAVYHIVALQSRWRPDSRVIMGCAMPYFAEMLHRSMERFLKGEIETDA
jgi:hypothetical protein